MCIIFLKQIEIYRTFNKKTDGPIRLRPKLRLLRQMPDDAAKSWQSFQDRWVTERAWD